MATGLFIVRHVNTRGDKGLDIQGGHLKIKTMKARNYFGLAALGLVMATPGTGADLPESFSHAARELLASAQPLAPSAHQVNVVYFLGKDAEPVADYERRLSELLLHLQQFYGREMDRNGYGKRSFGLVMKENGMVDILLIRGRHPAAEYSYEGNGAGKCLEEISDYFQQHPEMKRSHHTFVVMPTLHNQLYNDKNPGGVPFFGYGTNCFALDYPAFDIRHLGKDTEEGWLLTKWYGGFAHELGHGLNLPHNNGTASLNAANGMAMMNAGNSTFGRLPTYLTPASAAILDRSETFAVQGDPTEFYATTSPVPQVRDVHMEYDGEALHITFRCLGDCVHVNAYLQDPPYAVNQDYDAVAFTGTVVDEKPGELWLRFTLPRKEAPALRSDTQQLEFLFVEENGNRCRWNMEIKWNGLEPGVMDVPASFVPSRVSY